MFSGSHRVPGSRLVTTIHRTVLYLDLGWDKKGGTKSRLTTHATRYEFKCKPSLSFPSESTVVVRSVHDVTNDRLAQPQHLLGVVWLILLLDDAIGHDQGGE